MLGNGSDELIALLCATFAEPRAGQARAKIAYAVPGFVVFRTAALAHGLEPVEVPFGPRFEADEAALFAAVAEHKPNLIFLATPNNPTGTQWPRSTVVKLIEQHPDVITIVDEAYLAVLRRQELRRPGAGARQLPRAADAVEDRAGGAARRPAHRAARAARRRREGAAAVQPVDAGAARGVEAGGRLQEGARVALRGGQAPAARALRRARRRSRGSRSSRRAATSCSCARRMRARSTTRSSSAASWCACSTRACSPAACASPSAPPTKTRGSSTPSRPRSRNRTTQGDQRDQGEEQFNT